MAKIGRQGRGAGTRAYLAASLLAWLVWVVCAALLTLTVLLDYQYTPFTNKGEGNVYEIFGLPLLVYATIGAFVASRRPGNLVGWLLCAIGFVFALTGFGVAYADYVLLGHPDTSLPGGVYMACISQSLVVVPTLILVFTLLILLFPDGRLPDRTLRAVPWIVIVGGATSALWAISAQKVYGRYSLDNPLYLQGMLGEVVEGFGRLGSATVLICLVVAIITVFVRLGDASGAYRQQLKWFAYAAAVLLAILFLFPVIAWLLPAWVGWPLGIGGLCAIPAAVGIAVLRYRLYDIDRIINRTLVYGSLTALLLLAYFGVVTSTQALVRTLPGQDDLPQLVVVASTLVIAALFNPVRRRIQSFIDRRFYRRRYDATKTLEAFSRKLRNETDLEALSTELLSVIEQTMQPAHTGLWLRKPDARGSAGSRTAKGERL